MKADSDEAPSLPITAALLKGKKDVDGYQVFLKSPVEPDNEVKVVVAMVLIETIVPFPKEITQVPTWSS